MSEIAATSDPSSAGAESVKEDALAGLATFEPRYAAGISELQSALATGVGLERWFRTDLYRTFDPAHLIDQVAAVRPARLDSLLGLAELIRNVLVLVPVAATWVALEHAARVYATCTAAVSGSDALSRTPFLLLWERGFVATQETGINCQATSASFGPFDVSRFSTVIQFDAAVIFVVMALTAFIHFVLNVFGTRNAQQARAMASALRVRLAELSTQLESRRPAEDVRALAREASGAMRETAEAFREQTLSMLRALEGSAERTQAQMAEMDRTLASATNAIADLGRRMEASAEQMTSGARDFAVAAGRLDATVTTVERHLGPLTHAVTEGQLPAITAKLESAVDELRAGRGGIERIGEAIDKSETRQTTLETAVTAATKATSDSRGDLERIARTTEQQARTFESEAVGIRRDLREAADQMRSAVKALDGLRGTIQALGKNAAELVAASTGIKREQRASALAVTMLAISILNVLLGGIIVYLVFFRA